MFDHKLLVYYMHYPYHPQVLSWVSCALGTTMTELHELTHTILWYKRQKWYILGTKANFTILFP